MADDLAEHIRENASKPRQAAVDGVTAEQHSLTEQIAADKYLAARRAVAKNPARGFVRVKIVPPGTS